ncbi:Uma2 family endonuclease [Kitasatospora sp. NPDC096147]|uniref:Uma2 family endonuclease n=1 Tax=Kitasatospora sp. NPDC096147 TaxID=3364093 RepID=UPI00381CDCB9
MTAVPDWLIPPEGGFTAEDLDNLPDLPPHTELLDGSLVFMSPQKYFHSVAVDFLVWALRHACPEGLKVAREMSVILGRRDRPEPDLVVVQASAVSGEETAYQAADVLLAVEVVSPDSVERDRELKPRKYAEAGIPYYWRVEKEEGRNPVVYAFELEPATRRYVGTGIHRGRFKVEVPFAVEVDLTEIERM